jgi:hypothetical protein
MGLALELSVAAKHRDPQGVTRIPGAGWRSNCILLFAEESVNILDGYVGTDNLSIRNLTYAPAK